MCCEDVNIGRSTDGAELQVAVGDSSQNIIGANATRVAITFFPPIAGTVTVTTNATAVAGAGIVLVAGSNPVTLTLGIHGAVVTKGWNGIADQASRTVTVVEAMFTGC